MGNTNINWESGHNRVAAAHNDIFMKTFMQTKLSLAFPLHDPMRDNSEAARHYILKHSEKEVEGI